MYNFVQLLLCILPLEIKIKVISNGFKSPIYKMGHFKPLEITLSPDSNCKIHNRSCIIIDTMKYFLLTVS